MQGSGSSESSKQVLDFAKVDGQNDKIKNQNKSVEVVKEKNLDEESVMDTQNKWKDKQEMQEAKKDNNENQW